MSVLHAHPESRKSAVALHVVQLRLPLSVVLADRTMTGAQVTRLEVGSIIQFPRRVDQPLTLLAGDKPIAQGRVVLKGRNYALRITALARPPKR